jgi:DNA-binding CsgD family transcriptional regulator/predicted small secreted protein
MSLRVIFTLVFCFFISYSFGQKLKLDDYIKIWSTSDSTQTHKAQKTYSQLRTNLSLNDFRVLLNELYAFLDDNNDKRLKTRVFMFDLLGRKEYNIQRNQVQKEAKIKETIKLAIQLNDKQILAEVYALAGQLDLDNGFCLYNLKSIALQKQVGFENFCFVQTRFFNISYALFIALDYKQSIYYGLQGLKFKQLDANRSDALVYVFLLDIVGASYKQLKKYDSAQYYYQKIIDTLHKKPMSDVNGRKIWLGIAKGNIGHILSIQNKNKQAIPLIEEHLQSGIEQQYWDNAAMAQNNLASIYLKEKLYGKALAGFKKAYNWAIMSNKLTEKIISTKGLVDVYRLLNQPDTAFKYYNLYNNYKASLVEIRTKYKLSALKANIAFDDMQNDLGKANNQIAKQRLTRNFILISVVLLAIIALLIYNRKMIRQKNQVLKQEQKAKEALANVESSKIQINIFTERIKEKENLIYKLQSELASNSIDISSNLLQYTLITDAEWKKFREEFTKVYPLLLPALKAKTPRITPAEERLAFLIFLKLTNSQIANTLAISKDSVSRSKRRLKLKFDLPATVVLEDFISELG